MQCKMRYLTKTLNFHREPLMMDVTFWDNYQAIHWIIIKPTTEYQYHLMSRSTCFDPYTYNMQLAHRHWLFPELINLINHYESHKLCSIFWAFWASRPRSSWSWPRSTRCWSCCHDPMPANNTEWRVQVLLWSGSKRQNVFLSRSLND